MKIRAKGTENHYYENSTQEWLPVEAVSNGIVILKDGRYIKIVEVLPVNFYLKSETEQENIIYYFASYLKIAPDNLQIKVITQKADIEEYITGLSRRAENEQNELCRRMIYDEMHFVKSLSDNSAVKKRFFIVFEFAGKSFDSRGNSFSDICRMPGGIEYYGRRFFDRTFL